MKIGLFGGSQGVGFHFLEQALNKGHFITVLARTPSKITTSHPNLKIIQGDVMNYESVNQVIQGQDVIVNCLGSTSLTGDNITICSKGTEIIIQSMKKLQVKRILTVTSFGCGDSWKDTGIFASLFIYLVIGHLVRDKNIQESLIQESGLDWMIIRPSGLTNKEPLGTYKVGSGISGMQISRRDVADFLVKQLDSDEFLFKTPTITN